MACSLPLRSNRRGRAPPVLVGWIVVCASTVGCTDRDGDWKLESKPLDRQARAFLDRLVRKQAPELHTLTPSEAREAFAGMRDLFGRGPDDVQAEDLTLADRIPARAYKPRAAAAPLPVVVFFHGGGFVLGDLDTHDALCRRLAKQANCAVVAVDYRRAPEHPFPAALDDCYVATLFVAEHAGELGFDARRLAVAGDSAGGNLAAEVAIRARDEHQPAVLAQVLIYPSLDPACNSDSYRAYAHGYGLTKADMQWFWREYLDEQAVDARAAPAKASSLAGLPPAYLVTAEYDVLRNEGEAYARQLRAAGVTVRLHRVGGMVHGFVHFAGKFDAGLETTTEIAQELATYFQAGELAKR